MTFVSIRITGHKLSMKTKKVRFINIFSLVTTREKQAGEREGIDYHYITDEQFQAIRQEDGFVEFGQYQKTLYGTTIAAVRDVIEQHKICVLNLHAEVTK